MVRRPYVSADDIHKVFYSSITNQPILIGQMISAVLLIALIFYGLINGPAISQQLEYWWQSDIKTSQKLALSNQTTNLQTDFSNSTVVDELISRQILNSDRQSLTDNTILIPRIKVKAPIIWDVTTGADLNNDLLEALHHGVARYPQTALPNQVGNVFLTGHSSDYWWEKGNYKTIFALLNRLVVGDLIYVKYQNQIYTYRVKDQRVVKPTETAVLAPTQIPILSLMTCTPTGTALLRRIVTADLISPTLTDQIQTTAPPLDKAIRSVR